MLSRDPLAPATFALRASQSRSVPRQKRADPGGTADGLGRVFLEQPPGVSRERAGAEVALHAVVELFLEGPPEKDAANTSASC